MHPDTKISKQLMSRNALAFKQCDLPTFFADRILILEVEKIVVGGNIIEVQLYVGVFRCIRSC